MVGCDRYSRLTFPKKNDVLGGVRAGGSVFAVAITDSAAGTSAGVIARLLADKAVLL